jgi:superfamily II DNA or RNA helicase/HKD family nuclease
MGRVLVDGVYEELITRGLDEAIAEDRGERVIARVPLDPADAHVRLARHLRDELERALAAVRAEHGHDRLTRQVELANQVLEVLGARGLAPPDQHVAPPARELHAVAADATLVPRRPAIPLSSSALLTLGHGEPRIGNELAREMESADRVDVLISFITQGGVRQLAEAIDGLCRRHRPGEPARLRVLTTTYTGATEAGAVEDLARRPGVEIKVSYDARRTRLHAKAWLFHRRSGLSTVYVGSANLSAPALASGLEWTMKTSAAELPAVIDKFVGAFETLWADREFVPFDPRRADDRDRLRGALSAARGGDRAAAMTFFTLEPYEFQATILDQLEAERAIHGRHRNLVVAATGTGKTMIAAFDYARRAARLGLRPRLLFIAHTREILEQARAAFRQVLRDAAFGSLLTGRDEPASLDHLFATIQTLHSRGLPARVGDDHWRHVVVDECHHVPAASYQGVVPRLTPEVMVGLTATPERTDGRSLLPDFGGRVAAELRLWQALDRQLLAPFEYYGVHDGVSEAELGRVRWSRSAGYDHAGLDAIYTGNHARADLVLAELQRKADPARMRALGFCVSIAHARFMAAHFAARGIAAVALDGGDSPDVRARAQADLRDGTVRAIFTCDLFNEGVDLPFVDTLLLLRPTESATLFLQQLGRGLRLHEGKRTCLVLDFIGQHRAEFRFDASYSQLTGIPRGRLARAIEEGFPLLPSGCAMQLDAVARDTVLRSLRTSVEVTWKRLVAEAAALAGTSGTLTLEAFLADSGRELGDVYRLPQASWTKLRADAGLTPPPTDSAIDLCRRVGRLAHVDDHARLRRIEALARGGHPDDDLERREALMLAYQLVNESPKLMAAEGVAPWLHAEPALCEELREVSALLAERTSLPAELRPVPDWPLVLHRHYSRREILTACGVWNERRKVPHQQGIQRIQDQRRELLFVTLDKSDGRFSPSTRYRDYAISAERFHWETQNAVAAGSASARHYAEHVSEGWQVHLFVQTRKGEAFAYVGPVMHESQSGSRPVQIIWRLAYGLPAALLSECRTLAGA